MSSGSIFYAQIQLVTWQCCKDYLGSAYKLTTDNSIGVIRYTIDEASEITIPYSVNVKYPDASSSNVKLFEKDVKELIITGVQKKCNMVW